jgi:hypothetical protein
MAPVERNRQAVELLMREYHAYDPSRDGVESLLIVDAERRHYIWMFVGWEGHRRIHHVAVHVELRDEKVWLECDNTNLVVAEDLVAAGIPKDAIVLGFRAPEVRPYTGFAVG